MNYADLTPSARRLLEVTLGVTTKMSSSDSIMHETVLTK